MAKKKSSEDTKVNEVKETKKVASKKKKVEEVQTEVQEEQVVVQDQPVVKEKKKKSKFGIFLLIIILACVSILGYYVYEEYFSSDTITKDKDKGKDKDEDSESEENENKDKEEEEKYDGSGLLSYKGLEVIKDEKTKEKLKVYKDSYGDLCEKKGSGQWCTDVAFSIDVVGTAAKVLATLSDKYVLYYDKGTKLYDVKANKKYDVDIDGSYDSYQISASSSGTFEGFVYGNESSTSDYEGPVMSYVAYYDAINNKSILANDSYSNISVIYGDFLEAKEKTRDGYSSYGYDSYKVYLINKKTGEIAASTTGEMKYYGYIKYDGGYYIKEAEGYIGESVIALYTSSGKRILKIYDQPYSIAKDGKIYYYDDDEVIQYNTNGKVEKRYTLDYDGKLFMLIQNYALFTDDDELILYDVVKKDRIKLTDWDDDYYVHTMLSGYYDANQLANENEKEAGIYIVVETSGGVSEGEGVEFYINPKTNKVTKFDLDFIGGYAKPVLYLYPEKETEVSVNFEHEDSLTTTYPKFEDEWVVTAKPNGDLYDKDGKYYYGLYWEENGNHEVDFSTGFYVTKDNAIDFLEEKLTAIGLNDRERNEFIMYWLPILEKNGQSLVYFELTEERDAYNKLEISPAPDSLLRMAIHVKKVNEPVNIKEQTLPKFERKGFTAVEWGGVVHK